MAQVLHQSHRQQQLLDGSNLLQLGEWRNVIDGLVLIRSRQDLGFNIMAIIRWHLLILQQIFFLNYCI